LQVFRTFHVEQKLLTFLVPRIYSKVLRSYILAALSSAKIISF